MPSKLKIDCKSRRVVGRKLIHLCKYVELERQDAIIALFRGVFLFLKYIFVCPRCWLSVDNHFIWSFIGPVTFIIMVSCFYSSLNP